MGGAARLYLLRLLAKRVASAEFFLLKSTLALLGGASVKDLFPGYYRPSDDETATAWAQGLFVLDANVLLNLYRYPKQAREELLEVFARVEQRIWIPHHAALEYQRNRLSVISEQKRRFQDVREMADRIVADIEKESQRLQLRKRHSLIDVDDLVQKIKPPIEGFIARLDELESEQIDVNQKDSLRERVEGLCEGRVGAPYAKEEYEKISELGETRFKNNIPPGYMDDPKSAQKNPTFVHDGVIHHARFGDLIVWKQTMDRAKDEDVEFVIFITDDEKEDWWWIVDSGGRKRMGPRPELVQEIIRESKVAGLFMYSSLSFLNAASKMLHVEVSAESIEQVREVANADKNYLYDEPPYSNIFDAVGEYLRALYPNADVSADYQVDLDYIAALEGSRRAFHFYPVTDADLGARLLRNYSQQHVTTATETGVDHLSMMLVTDRRDIYQEAVRLVSEPESKIPDEVGIIVCLASLENGSAKIVASTVVR